jgi:hypothetical protein
LRRGLPCINLELTNNAVPVAGTEKITARDEPLLHYLEITLKGEISRLHKPLVNSGEIEMNSKQLSFNARLFYFWLSKLWSGPSANHRHKKYGAVLSSIFAKATVMRCAFLTGSLLLLNIGASNAAWTTAHGNPDNTGFANADTQPAVKAANFVDVGPVESGANPVTGPDGTVYIGNTNRELIALHADGSFFWKRKLNRDHGPILASPAVGSDGSIYVVSSRKFVARDTGFVTEHSYLHKFNSTGAWLGSVLFPGVNSWPDRIRGLTSAPPNIWRHNGVEVVMVPAIYAGVDVRLVAISTDLVVLSEVLVTRVPYDNDIYGEWPSVDLGDVRCYYGIFCGVSYNPTVAVPPFTEAGWPAPGVAIWHYPQGSPYIWVADNWKSTVAYKFDPASGFSQIYRFSDKYSRLSSPPVALANVIAAVGAQDRLKFERQNFEISGFAGLITAAPTRMAGGRLVTIERSGNMSVINGTAVVMQQPLNGQSIASAAASCNHLFVASTNELVTFDTRNMMPVARVAWSGGGRHSPIIGPRGQVYALTESGLFVFPPKQSNIGIEIGGSPTKTGCDQHTQGGAIILKR